ncbi:MAG TPA: acetolactate synthase [Acidimicrobiia bacterium]|nr:acetolactate synthase [Acidimicrobiia bacterium]
MSDPSAPSPDGGYLAAATLRAHGVDTMFTLSGGHLFPLYDGCVKTDLRLVDTRHEQTAAFAAEGWAKVTRRVGVAALTAGPGVTNGISALTSAHMNGSPMCVIGGRAPSARWGVGSLQELDHIPIVAPVTKAAGTLDHADAIPGGLGDALRAACTPHRGPVFVDVPLDAWGPSDAAVAGPPDPTALAGPAADPGDLDAVARLVGAARRPVLMIGGDVYWAGAEAEVLAFAEAVRIPVFANDMGRGVVPADHDLAFSRARSAAFSGADLMIVAGTPLDFRLAFGAFAAPVVHLADSPAGVARHVELEGSAAGDLRAAFATLADTASSATAEGARTEREDWIRSLRDDELAKRSTEQARLDSDSDPIDPARIFGELRARLDRDAIVIGDGGDFVSYAGKYVDTFTPGCFLGPGPYGCLGSGTGYALAAALAHSERQVVVCFGDGAIGFTLGDLDTLVRHGVNVTAVVGNNGIWGLEKHPMQMIFGYDVVAELRPGTRYDLVAEALGGHGELVAAPSEIGPALDRAFAHDGCSVVNVLTDPGDAYPRSSNLG